MTAAWDREAAMRVAEWFGRFGHDMPRQAAALLRAADAEITRLRAREADAEKMAETMQGSMAAWREAMPMRTADFHGEACSCLRCAMDRNEAALAAWDASRGEDTQ